MSATEIEKVKIRIRALLAKTTSNGCTEHEAISAAAKVGELLDAFGLSMSDVEVRDQTCVKAVINTNRNNRHAIDYCASAIAAFCDCRVWTGFAYDEERTKIGSKTKYNRTYNFFGLPQDTEMAVYLFHLISASLDSEAKEFKNTKAYANNIGHTKKSAYVSFQHGMSRRISSRLYEMKHERDQAMKETRTTGTSLVVLKGEVVERDFRLLDMKL